MAPKTHRQTRWQVGLCFWSRSRWKRTTKIRQEVRFDLLYERTFDSKPLKSFKVYDDPFGESEVRVELVFVDGEIEYIGIGPGRPWIVTNAMCRDVD